MVTTSDLVKEVLKDIRNVLMYVLWHPVLRLQVMLAGGREKYLSKKNAYTTKEMAHYKSILISSHCKYSVLQRRWCILPCTHCWRVKLVKRKAS